MIRRGFTLIEVMISIVVTGLVSSLAFAAAQAGFDTDARLEAYRLKGEREGVVRAFLFDALRHSVEGVRGGSAIFVLVDRAGLDGRAADSVQVVTRGVLSPLGTSEAWRVTAWLVGDTLQLEAHADGASAPGSPPLTMRLGGVAAFDVQLLGRGLGARWRGDWPDADVSPEAMSLTLGRDDGAPARIVVRRSLERAP